MLTSKQNHCSSRNKAINLCLNKECREKNPFLCETASCQCHRKHLSCVQKRIEVVSKSIQTQDHIIKRIKNLIESRINKITKKLEREQKNLIDRIHEQSLGEHFLERQQSQEKQVKPKLQFIIENSQINKKSKQSNQSEEEEQSQENSSIDGKNLLRMWTMSKEMQKELSESKLKRKINLFSSQIYSSIDYFYSKLKENCSLETLTDSKYYWNPQSLHQRHYIIDGKRLRVSQLVEPMNIKKIDFSNVITFSNSMNKILDKNSCSSNILKFQIKIISLKSSIALGITKGTQNENQMINELNAFYMLKSEDRFIYFSKNKEQGKHKNLESTVKIKSGDLINVEFDIKEGQLKFSKGKSKISFSFDQVEPLRKNQEYFVCAYLAGPGDQIEIILPLQVGNQISKKKRKMSQSI